MPGTVDGFALHARPDRTLWAPVPSAAEPEPGTWADRVAARFSRADRHGVNVELMAANLLEVCRGRGSMVAATFVAWLERRLTVVDVSILATAPAGPERDRRLGLPAALSAGTVLIDRFCYEGLGQARRVLRFTYPGATEGLDDAPSSMRCLWRPRSAVDVLVTVSAPDAEPFLKALPTVDALLDTLQECWAPGAAGYRGLRLLLPEPDTTVSDHPRLVGAGRDGLACTGALR